MRLVDLLISIAIALAAALYGFLHIRKKESARPPSVRPPGIDDRTLLTSPVPFGYKTAWFAIQSTDMHAVAAALHLENPQPAGWSYGIWHSIETEDYAIFVTPPINGWILAVGVPILYEADFDTNDHATERLIALSQEFGEAQFFASMRITSSTIWARARNGKLLRRFYDCDGTHQETGEQSDEEKALDLRFFEASSPEAQDPDYWKRKDLVFPDERHVLQIAGGWGVDPSKLDQMGLAPATGLLGGVSTDYPPKPPSYRRPRKST
jgi:hypothetical protein